MCDPESFLSKDFLRQVCATYQRSQPDMLEAEQEGKELKISVAMLRTAVEMSDQPSDDFIALLTRLITHIEHVGTLLTRMQTIARQVNAIMMEFEE